MPAGARRDCGCPGQGGCGCGCEGNVDIGCAANPVASATAATVHLNSGRFALQLPGLSVPGIGAPWSFSLTHLSNVSQGADVPGFESRQQARMVIVDDKGDTNPDNDDVAILNGQFSKAVFRFKQKVGNTVFYEDASGATARLTKDTVADEFTLTSPRQTVSKFFGFNTPGVAPGRLKSIRTAVGDEFSFQYTQVGGEWHLTSELDTAGRAINYSYAAAAGRQVLREVTDFLGRKITLQYDSTTGNLVAVIGPSVTVGAPGNSFPGGKAYVLQYDTGNADPNRRKDIVKVYFPKQVAPYLDTATRTVDVAAVYANATPRHVITYGQNAADPSTYGRVMSERIGDGGAVGGTYQFQYQFAAYGASLPAGVALRTTMTDPNGNVAVHDFDGKGNRVRLEAQTNRNKSSKNPASFVTTWEYSATDNLLLRQTFPEGNSAEYTYDDGVIRDPATGNPLFTLRSRVGFLLKETHKPGPRGGDQAELTTRYFPDPVFSRELVRIDPRGNPIDAAATYFTPQNGGPTPTDTDRSRYATWTRYDYEEDGSDANKQALADLLGITLTQFNQLLAWQDKVLKDGGLPQGYQFGLGDINGDGRTDQRMGNPIKAIRPAVTLIPGSNQAQVEGSTTQQIVTTRTYNDRGQLTTETDPEGNVTAYVRYPENDPDGDGLDLIPGKSTKQYGYLKEVHVDVNPADLATLIGSGPNGGDLTSFTLMVPRRNTPGVYQNLTTRYTYDRAGNAKTVTDPRGSVTAQDFNELDQIYRVTGPAPFSYRRETHYDAHNNVIRADVEDKVASVVSSDPANPNYMKVAVTLEPDGKTANFPVAAGPGGSIRPGWFTDLTDYDFLDRPIRQDLDATGSTPSRLVTTWQYDRNGNRTKETRPEGNTVEWDYDERNLPIAERRGGNDPTVAATTVNVHDGNGNLKEAIDAADTDGSPGNNDTVTIQDAFGSGTALVHTGDVEAEHVYDGYDRTVVTIDAVGGTTERAYDPLGNVIRVEQKGQIGGPSPTDRSGFGNVLLARTHQYFDEGGRQYETQRDVFLPSGVTLGSGRAVTHTEGGLLHNSAANTHNATVTLTAGQSTYVLERTELDRASRVTHQISDDLGTIVTAYDGVNRVIKVTDPEGNSEETTYDANGNGIQIKRVDKSQLADVADEVFITKFAYDVMNRQTWVETQGPDGDITTTADNQITRIAYNSRDLATHFRDALDNTRVDTYDGAGRPLKMEEHLRLDGTGATPLDPTQSGDGIITSEQMWDGNSRRLSLKDDNGNTTTFGYDALDRQNRLTFADGRSRTWQFDRDSNVTRYTDENGSVSDRTYDALNRLTGETITRAAGIIGTTQVAMQYDGLGRITRATDNGDPADTTQSSLVAHVYDSLGRLVEESLQIGSTGTVRYTTGTAWQAGANRTALTYPNGRKVLTTYDGLDRLKTIRDDGVMAPIATWRYIGSDRLLEMAYQNGLCLTHLNNTRTASANQPGMPAGELRGYDGVGRVITHRWLACTLDANGFATGYTSTTPVIGFRHVYEASDTKLSEEKAHDPDNSEAYDYDSAYRLIEFDRGTLNSTLTEVVMPTATPGLLQAQDWTLDGPGNWPSNTTTTGGVTTTENRTHNNLNQITARDGTPLLYDANGNLIDDGIYLYAWDAKNRLRRVTRKSDSAVVGRYAYDAFGRRIRRVYIVGTNPAKTIHYYLDDQRVIEEREPDGSGGEPLARQYTYGLYVDEALTLDRDLNGDGVTTGPGERLFYHANTLYSVFGLSDASRNFVERYLYDAYGRPYLWLPGPDGIYGSADDIFTADGQSTVQNTRLFTGREGDPESSIFYYRARYSHPRLGRFASRDPLVFDGGDINLYALVSNQPTNAVDPTGEQIGVQFLKGYACIRRGISAWCICIDWEFNAGWQICCRNNRLTWIKQFKGCLTVGIYLCSSKGMRFYQPFIIRFSPPFGKPKVVPRVFGPIPAVRPGVPIGPIVAPQVYGQCPPSGCSGEACVQCSIGYAAATLGFRVCVGANGVNVAVGYGIGSGTGCGIGGCLTCND